MTDYRLLHEERRLIADILAIEKALAEDDMSLEIAEYMAGALERATDRYQTFLDNLEDGRR